MALERTLSIVKPDGVSRNLIGEVYRRFEKAGLSIIAARMMHLSQREAEGFYAVHRERPFFKDLVKYMTSGPVIVQVLEGENAIAKNREIMGATDPKKAAPGTIRADSRRASSRTWCTAPTRRRPPPSRSRTSSARRSCTRAADAARCTHVMNSPAQTNLLGLAACRAGGVRGASLGSKPFRARQLMNWVYKRGEGSFANMTDLAKDFRAQLQSSARKFARRRS